MNKSDFDDADLEFDASLVKEAVDTVIYDDEERQLSSDLKNTLTIRQGDYFVSRGPPENVFTKSEIREGCMYTGHTNTPVYMPLFPHQQQQQQVHGEMHSGYIRPASFDPMIQPHSVEMDNALSMFSVRQPPPQVQYKPGPFGGESLSQKGIQPVDHFENPPFPADNQGMASSFDETIPQNEDVAMETGAGNFSYQLDEIGECTLHTLSLVTDRNVMARVLEAVQNSGSLPEMINLQNKLKQTPLFLAVQAFNAPLIGWLLQNGADPNIQGTLQTGRHEYVWRAPLHLVAAMGDNAISILRMLLMKYPALDLNLLSIGDKLTPLHIALKTHLPPEKSCSLLVKELVQKGADVRIREQASSKTPLILVIETRDLNLISEYLDMFTADRRRALLQDKTRAGDTCLHIAAGLSRFPSNLKEVLLRMLVMHGANGNTANNAKELPRDFARAEWDRIRS